MRQASPIITGITTIALLGIAACARKVATVSRPPDIAPVATVSPQPSPAQAPAKATTVAPAPVRQVAAQPSKPTAMPAAVRKRLSDEVARLEDALFDYDRSTIRSDASVALRDDVSVIRDILADYPSQKLIIEGHADARGSAEYNLALGDRRAHAVQEFLSTMGIPNSQLTIVSYGKEKPVCTEESENCWQKNRRAHLIAAN